LNEQERSAILATLTDDEAALLTYAWEFWARPQQLPPATVWTIWLILAGRGFGKALALDTPIPTLTGWTTMGEVRVGDTLFDEHGCACAVTLVAPVMLGHKCYDVVFDDGTVITADAEHEWLTWTHAARKSAARRTGKPSSKPQCQPRVSPSVVTTEEIRGSLLYGERERNHSIDVAGSLCTPQACLPVHPYV
jgi:replicative DNA helicase